MFKGLLNPLCIKRPGFLWFQRRKHEPATRLTHINRTQDGILHVYRRGHDYVSHVEHYVVCVCLHCGQPYITPYRSAQPISWRTSEEVTVAEANQKATAAWNWYKERLTE